MDEMGRRILVKALLGLVAMGLFQCERTADYQPKMPDQARFKVHHLGTYSSKLNEEKEIPGTIFQTTLDYRMDKEDGQWRFQRKLDTMIGKGYHKLSMPHELEKKVDLDVWLGPDLLPARIEGYDSLRPILARIPQKEEYTKQLLKASDSTAYKAWLRDWWRLNNFPPHGKLEARQSLPVEALNKQLETFQVDSARFDGPRPRNKKSCLDFTFHYHRSDSLPLLMEQFFFSSNQNRKYRRYTWQPGPVKGSMQFSMERATGMPCFHSRTEISDITLDLKEEKTQVPVQLYRYEEDIYQY